jgi:hypothetical protein
MGRRLVRTTALAAAAALQLLLPACSVLSHQITGYPTQPAMTQPPVVQTTTVEVNWTADVDEIGKHCGQDKIYYGCASYTPVLGHGICTVWAPLPSSFNDLVRLAILGHEFLHCLGARHG